MFTGLLQNELLENLANMPAVALLEPRQVGKTTLSLEIIKQRPAIYLDLEDANDLAKLQDPKAYLLSHNDKLIILDEIQRLPEVFRSLRGIIDKNIQVGKNTGQFLLLGSASLDLLQQSSESLTSRISYLELH